MAAASSDPGPHALGEALKLAMRRMPGPVSLVTTRDPLGDAPAGMIVSAVIPVSMTPPSMLVAINRDSTSHASIERAGRFCVNLLSTDQTNLVAPFSSPVDREQRFASGGWADRDGIPFLEAACANIFCEVRTTLIHGTHELFIGNAYAVRCEEGSPLRVLGWVEGGFADIRTLD